MILDRFRLDDQVAVVTGAGRGLGAAMALAFAEAGADVVIASRTQSQLEDVAKQIEGVGRKAHIVVADLAHPDENRWPAYGPVMLDYDIRGVYAIPVVVAGAYVGALDFFCTAPDRLAAEQIASMAIAAELAQLPLLDLLEGDLKAATADPDSDAWAELDEFSRTEVSQATGMLMAQLNVDAATALARLRARAYATGCSASAVARDIIDRRLQLEAD